MYVLLPNKATSIGYWVDVCKNVRAFIFYYFPPLRWVRYFFFFCCLNKSFSFFLFLLRFHETNNYPSRAMTIFLLLFLFCLFSNMASRGKKKHVQMLYGNLYIEKIPVSWFMVLDTPVSINPAQKWLVAQLSRAKNTKQVRVVRKTTTKTNDWQTNPRHLRMQTDASH